MTVSFYNEHGCMNGIDFHEVQEVPMPMQVTLLFSHGPCTPKKAKDVRMDGVRAIRGGIDYYFVPHAIVGQGYLPLEPFTMLSGSKAWMAVHSVTINGDSAATCLGGPVSNNVNCNDPFDHPGTNWVINLNSVVTMPTPGDYAGSMAGAATDILIGWGVGKAAKNTAKHLIDDEMWQPIVENVQKQNWRRAPDASDALTPDNADKATKDRIRMIFDTPSVVTEQVQQYVDSVLK